MFYILFLQKTISLQPTKKPEPHFTSIQPAGHGDQTPASKGLTSHQNPHFMKL